MANPGHRPLSVTERLKQARESRGLSHRQIAEVAKVSSRIIAALEARDPEFKAVTKPIFARAPYEIAPTHELPAALVDAASATGTASATIGMSFWTDAAVLGMAGIPSVLFGPTGSGLHGLEEWVDTQSVLICRDALVKLARAWCR